MAKEKIEVEFEGSVSSSTRDHLANMFSGAIGKAVAAKKAIGQFASGVAEGAGAAGSEALAAAGPVGVAMAVGFKLKEVIGQALEFAQKTFDTIKSFVSIANPGVVEHFDEAWNDLYAVIGHTLTPIVERLAPVVEDLGDFLASIIPSAEDLDKILAEMQPIWDELRSVLVLIAPLLKDVALGILKIMEVAARFLKWVFGSVPELTLIHDMAKAGKGHDFEKSARDSAAQGASFTTLEGLGKNFQLAAFSQGLPPMQRTADAAESIDKKMDRLVGAEPVKHPRE